MTYNKQNKYFIYRFILIQLFPIIILINVHNYLIIIVFWLILLLLFVFSEFYSKTLYAVKINDNKVSLFYFQFFLKKKVEYSPTELMYSYKKEVGARGIKSMEFRIYKNQEVIIKGIGRSIDGWMVNTINEVIEEFKKIGIKENDYGNK